MQYLKKEIRERIIDAAMEEFNKLGFADASIRNIAQTAKTSLGNVYRYFTNKEALYLAVVNPVINATEKRADLFFEFTGEAYEKLPVMIMEFVNEYAEGLSIVVKGSAEHYEKFIRAVISCVAENIKKLFTERHPSILKKIKNPDFYSAAASSFVYGLFFIIQQNVDDESKIKYLREYLFYFFNQVESRLN